MKTAMKKAMSPTPGIIHTIGIFLFVNIILPLHTAQAQTSCDATNKTCVMDEILLSSTNITNDAWRDKVLRELAKSYTYEGNENKAISLIEKIENPDTKAMTIRGIGFAAADKNWANKERYTSLFQNLMLEANKISHKPSYAIAYTYIAMAQAFAKDNQGAMETAKLMENDALRNKAYGETAEIQAERGDFENAMLSIEAISSISFKNKAYGTISGIFTKAGKLKEAYAAAHKIDNHYAQAQALQKIVNFGNEEEMLK